MPLQKTLFLIFLLLITGSSCQTDLSKNHSLSSLPIPGQKEKALDNKPLLAALESLRKDPSLKNGSLGYLVVDITAKNPVVVADYRSKWPMMPASTLKIFVTGAALDILGKEIIPEVTITNLMSVNWRSSKLLRKIGGKVYNTATTVGGVKAILDFWEERGVDTHGMFFYDGNGLSRRNAISPKQLVDALYAIRTSPSFHYFYESLPLAGLTGTLHKAMKGTAAEGRIHAKTGTISKVKSFAGYISTLSGRRLVFSLLVNDFDCRPKLMKKKLEAVLIKMAEIKKQDAGCRIQDKRSLRSRCWMLDDKRGMISKGGWLAEN
ncbi:MAG: D-alanyl-D-alanine carboxypeptidase [Bacteroidales bacterium]|nr:D-alanyl-D-alanine carboxypeptidase [Bacteroidales bacterium]